MVKTPGNFNPSLVFTGLIIKNTIIISESISIFLISYSVLYNLHPLKRSTMSSGQWHNKLTVGLVAENINGPPGLYYSPGPIYIFKPMHQGRCYIKCINSKFYEIMDFLQKMVKIQKLTYEK